MTSTIKQVTETHQEIGNELDTWRADNGLKQEYMRSTGIDKSNLGQVSYHCKPIFEIEVNFLQFIVYIPLIRLFKL